MRRLSPEDRTIANALVYAIKTVGEPLAARWAHESNYEDFAEYQAAFKKGILNLIPTAENIKLTVSPFSGRCAVLGRAARVNFKFEKRGSIK